MFQQASKQKYEWKRTLYLNMQFQSAKINSSNYNLQILTHQMTQNFASRPKAFSQHTQRKTLYDTSANLSVPQYFLYQKIQALRWVRKYHENIQELFQNLNNYTYRCSPLDFGCQIEVSIHFQDSKLEFININFGTIFLSDRDQQIQKKLILKHDIPARLLIKSSQHTDKNQLSKNMVWFQNVNGTLRCKKNDLYQFSSEQLQFFKVNRTDASCELRLDNGLQFCRKIYGQELLQNQSLLNEQDLYYTIKFSNEQLWSKFLLMVNQIKTKNAYKTPFGEGNRNSMQKKNQTYIHSSVKTYEETDCEIANQSKNLSFFSEFYDIVYQGQNQTPGNDEQETPGNLEQSFQLNQSFKKLDAILGEGKESIVLKKKAQNQKQKEQKQTRQLQNLIKELQFEKQRLLIENINLKNDISLYQQQKHNILSQNMEIKKLEKLKEKMQENLSSTIQAKRKSCLLSDRKTKKIISQNVKAHKHNNSSSKSALKAISKQEQEIQQIKIPEKSAFHRVKRLISEITISSRQSVSKYKRRNVNNS